MKPWRQMVVAVTPTTHPGQAATVEVVVVAVVAEALVSSTTSVLTESLLQSSGAFATNYAIPIMCNGLYNHFILHYYTIS